MEIRSDAIYWYVDDFRYQMVAESGNPSDRYHLGKVILRRFREDPNFLLQIDGATDERDTFGTMLVKSIRCAESFRRLGIKRGDVIVLMAPNCLDLTAPLYAAFYLGIAVACIDMNLVKAELKHIFNDTKPKFVFCLASKAHDVQDVLTSLNIDGVTVTFGKEKNFDTFPEFLDKYCIDSNVDNFQVEEFDPVETEAILISTSGTTGLPKVATLTHKNCSIGFLHIWGMIKEFPAPDLFPIIISPVQWLSAHIHFVYSPILKYTRLQTSMPMTTDHVYDLINKYRPTYILSSPTFMVKLLTPGERDKCDFTTFKWFFIGGSAVFQEVIDMIKSVNKTALVYKGYGLSESTGLCFDVIGAYRDSCGKPYGHYKYRLVDVDTQKDINECNVSGELWVKGPTVFKGYWNNPKETQNSLTADGWLRTGDIFYRDENYNFYFVDRFKLLLKYRNHQISPTEIENLIRGHPGVLDVAVTSIPDLECGDLPVACVKILKGAQVTAQEIKDLVKNNLTDTKQLRGGVLFVQEFPTTPSGKINRGQLKKMVAEFKDNLL